VDLAWRQESTKLELLPDESGAATGGTGGKDCSAVSVILGALRLVAVTPVPRG
jgi:hypothetical protein